MQCKGREQISQPLLLYGLVLPARTSYLSFSRPARPPARPSHLFIGNVVPEHARHRPLLQPPRIRQLFPHFQRQRLQRARQVRQAAAGQLCGRGRMRCAGGLCGRAAQGAGGERVDLILTASKPSRRWSQGEGLIPRRGLLAFLQPLPAATHPRGVALRVPVAPLPQAGVQLLRAVPVGAAGSCPGRSGSLL